MPGIHVLTASQQERRGWPGHRRAEATPSFRRLCPAMTSCDAPPQFCADVNAYSAIRHAGGAMMSRPRHSRAGLLMLGAGFAMAAALPAQAKTGPADENPDMPAAEAAAA